MRRRGGARRTIGRHGLRGIARRILERRGTARLQMSLMVCATGLSGFLSSVLMLELGLEQMAVRYGLAVLIAYLVFLFLVWLWVLHNRRTLDAGVVLDGLDVLEPIVDLVPGGGGSAESVGPSLPAEAPFSDAPTTASSPSAADSLSDAGSTISSGFDLDEAIVVVVVAVAVLSALAAAAYVIWIAPAMLGEVMVDGVLSVGLYRRLSQVDRKHWLEGVVARTVFPFLWVGLFFVVAGAVMQRYAPEAISIGGVWQHFRAPDAGGG